MAPIDPVMLGLGIGATFIARSFSGDKEQLVPILKAGIAHRGFALVDIISPCVTFNDHKGSTKSYLYTRQHELRATRADFVPQASEILANISQNGATTVTMHDGSVVHFTAVPENYDPTDRRKVFECLEEHQGQGQVVTGLPYEKLCPGADELHPLQEEFR